MLILVPFCVHTCRQTLLLLLLVLKQGFVYTLTFIINIEVFDRIEGKPQDDATILCIVHIPTYTFRWL